MVFYSQRSQITSGTFLAILTGTPIVMYRKKSWTHHTGRGESLAIQHPSQEVARAREMLSPQQLALTWAQSGSTLGPPLLVEQGAQVPMICPCPLGQPHLFTRCSVTRGRKNLGSEMVICSLVSCDYTTYFTPRDLIPYSKVEDFYF